ncbi:DUF429 domain-containing protein [Paraferrimonas haliotis]|uniref:DUF429 domain-containing protein n=1 Tax=Paraferrimonas haliotis TaxID=2013866 RepID=UPI000BA92417|nr:DUF429 domain-containing protein [Paraferrimonas haliotis]
MKLVGIDLAWQGDNNPSAIAVGDLSNDTLILQAVEPALFSLEDVLRYVRSLPKVRGIAVDAPLVINNETGQRQCERAINRDYADRKTTATSANLTLYPDAPSVQLSRGLEVDGFSLFDGLRWQVECAQSPAMIECFGLNERLQYKSGKVNDKKVGQIRLAGYLQRLEKSPVLKLVIPPFFKNNLTTENIASLKGKALKENEDALGAIMCLYIAALYEKQVPSKLYGTPNDGHLWVPTQVCL